MTLIRLNRVDFKLINGCNLVIINRIEFSYAYIVDEKEDFSWYPLLNKGFP